MQCQYIAKKSAWESITFWRVVLFWLIVPLFMMIFGAIINSCFSIEFYENKIVQKSGWLNKREKTNVFAGVLSVSVDQSLWGRMCNYGDVRVDVQGKWDIDTTYIKDPQGLKQYLESRVASASNLNFFGHQ